MTNYNERLCEHNYQAVKYTVQEVHSHYVGLNEGNEAVKVSLEKIMLFCTKCGNKIEADKVDE